VQLGRGTDHSALFTAEVRGESTVSYILVARYSRVPGGSRILSFPRCSDSGAHSHIRCAPGVNRSGREAHHSPQTSAEVKEASPSIYI
jgi:hypothetical protein